ncbi:hypothetical protein [Aureimonas sp. AU4]|uniref:hypothetical protein n=1 Tax=Aureimonas sp. AU4 TaxID=1638163 RepID=UPI000780F66B|nr:hypothetical protein [Aureimonas sp. AU4]
MAFSALVKAAIERCRAFYNGGIWVPGTGPGANPGGYDADGHTVNFVPTLRDVATIADAVGDAAAKVDAAMDAIEKGPVVSVVGKSGIVTADDIKTAIDYSSKVNTSDFTSLETELRGDVQDAIDALPDKASGADLRALADDTRFLTPKANADAMAFVTVAATATITPDLGQGFNRTYTMGMSATLGQPSNLRDGLPIVFRFIQDATGNRTLAFASAYHKFPGGAVPTLSTAANAVDRLSGMCVNRGGTLVVEWANLEKDIR